MHDVVEVERGAHLSEAAESFGFVTRGLALFSRLVVLQPRLLEGHRQLGDGLLGLGGRLLYLRVLARFCTPPTDEEDERRQEDERRECGRADRRPRGAIADIALPSNGL